MKLPLKYTETMKVLLGEEYDAYLASFDEVLRTAREHAEAFPRGNGGEGGIFSQVCAVVRNGVLL